MRPASGPPSRSTASRARSAISAAAVVASRRDHNRPSSPSSSHVRGCGRPAQSLTIARSPGPGRWPARRRPMVWYTASRRVRRWARSCRDTAGGSSATRASTNQRARSCGVRRRSVRRPQRSPTVLVRSRQTRPPLTDYTGPQDRRVTVRDLQVATDRGERWAMLTSYDALTAGVFERAGVRALLVGDTAALMVYGHDSTLPVTMDQLVPLVQAVVRGTRSALVVADLPLGAYQASPQQAFDNAVRHLKEGGAQAVKLEGGEAVLPQRRTLVQAGIPVMGHLGLTPQSEHALGGTRRVQGRGDAGERLLEDAVALQEAGAFAVVLEAIPAELGTRVSRELSVPTVGIGAGAGCDAQILVWQDLAGLTTGHVPRFVKRYADLDDVLTRAVATYVNEVAEGAYPTPEHSYA